MSTHLEVLRTLIGTRSVAATERAAGFTQGALSKRLTGSTTIRADDLIAVAHATGHDPVKVLMDAGIIDQAPAGDLRSIPDDIREWARGEGIALADRGRITADIEARYHAEVRGS